MIKYLSIIIAILAFVVVTGCKDDYDKKGNILNAQGGQCLYSKYQHHDQSVRYVDISNNSNSNRGFYAFTYYFEFLDLVRSDIDSVIFYDVDSEMVSIEFANKRCIVGIVMDTRKNFYNKVNGIPYINVNDITTHASPLFGEPVN